MTKKHYGTLSVDSIMSSKNYARKKDSLFTSVCMTGDRMDELAGSVLSAFAGARGRLGVCWEAWGAFLGRIPSFSLSLSGRRAVNDVNAIICCTASNHWYLSMEI